MLRRNGAEETGAAWHLCVDPSRLNLFCLLLDFHVLATWLQAAIAPLGALWRLNWSGS